MKNISKTHIFSVGYNIRTKRKRRKLKRNMRSVIRTLLFFRTDGILSISNLDAFETSTTKDCLTH